MTLGEEHETIKSVVAILLALYLFEYPNSMTDIKDLSKIIASKGNKPLVVSIVNLQSPEDSELERKLRELKFKQELRKDWILFIVRDVVIISAAILFIFAVSGYLLFTQIHR